MNFYTNIAKLGNNILVREITDGIPNLRKVKFEPTYYIKSVDGKFTSLYGDKAKDVHPGGMYESKEWIKSYVNVGDFEIFGQTNEILQFANGYNFTGWDFNQIKTFSIDIETSASPDGSFPDPKYALGVVQLITIQDFHTKRFYTWGLKPYNKKSLKIKTEYTHCVDEKNLLKQFLMFWEQQRPDVVTGWNSNGFDMPYLINRIIKILDQSYANKLSPWGNVTFKLREYKGREEIEFSIAGVSCLDYLELYKKFTFGNHESYSLGNISSEELGTTKLVNPTDSFEKFYTEHGDGLFIDYNLTDVLLVSMLEEKLKLIQLAMTMAYEARVNYEDVFSPVKVWDAILHNDLLKDNIVSPQRKSSGIPVNIEGAYVITPVPGMYHNVTTIDFLSLYPSIMVGLNLSPETYLGQCDSNVEKCLNGVYENKDPDVSMGVNGSLYSRKKPGIMPKVIKKYMKMRRDDKNAMLEYDKQIEVIKSTTNDKKELSNLSSLRSSKDNSQMAWKILTNSLYGSLANAGFRYYNSDIAESITITGQLLIRSIKKDLTVLVNEEFKYDFKDITIAGDTDSAMICLDEIVKKFSPNTSVEENIKIIEGLATKKIGPLVKRIVSNVTTGLNFHEDTLYAKPEIAASHMLILAKKKYCARVYSSEGVAYAKPKQKIMGMEIVKSSTPKVVQKALKDSIDIIFDSDEKMIQSYIEKVKNDFTSYSVEEIAFPRGLSNLSEYSNSNTIYSKGTPIHVRAALLYNHLIDKHKLGNKYELLKEGNKLRFVYLKIPNTIRENIIGWPVDSILPPEFDLHKYIDHDLQFEKVFLSAIELMINPMGWQTVQHSDLSEFF